jgi:DNA-binding response OmpR family regulator
MSQEEEIHILFVAQSLPRLKPAANFLSRRGVRCSIVTSIKEALEYIGNRKPGFVFLSTNLPGTNHTKIMTAFTQTFNVTVIMFAELGDAKTAAILSNSGAKHFLHAPISGPKIFMRVQRIIKEMNEPDVIEPVQNEPKETYDYGSKSRESNYTTRSAGAKEDLNITISGESSDASSFNITQSSKNQSDQQFHGQDSDFSSSQSENHNIEHSPQIRKTEIKVNKSHGRGSSTYTINEEDPGFQNARVESDQVSNPKKLAANGDIGQVQTNDSHGRKQEHESNEGEFSPAAKGGGSFAWEKKKQRSSEEKKRNQDQGDEVGTSSEFNPAHEVSKPPGTKTEIQNSKTPSSRVLGIQRSAAQSTGRQSKSVLSESAEYALNQTAVVTGQMEESVNETSRIGAIPVNSARFKGYLLVAVGTNRVIDTSFIESLNKKLTEYLASKGENVRNEEDGFHVQIEKMEFVDWAQEFGEFLTLGQDRKNEVAIAFIASEGKIGGTQDSVEENMLAIDVADIVPEQQIAFDAYLYFPKNRKYFKYVKEGGAFSSNQIEKLKKEDVRHLHIKTADHKKFSQYAGSNFIKSKITQDLFQSKKKKKTG